MPGDTRFDISRRHIEWWLSIWGFAFNQSDFSSFDQGQCEVSLLNQRAIFAKIYTRVYFPINLLQRVQWVWETRGDRCLLHGEPRQWCQVSCQGAWSREIYIGNTLRGKNEFSVKTRSSWVNCALRDDEAVYCVSIGHFERWQLVLDDNGSVEGIYAFIYWTKWRSGQVSRIPDPLTHWQLWKIELLSSL